MRIEEIYEDETRDILMKCCVLTCLAYNLQYKIHNIFILLIKDKNVLAFFQESLCCNSKYETIELFLRFNPDLAKNKAVSNFISGL